MRVRLALLAPLAFASVPAFAQGVSSAAPAPRAASESTVVVTPGARYRAGHLRRMLLGADYRELWATPISVAVLDLHATAGGLRPTKRGGGEQTRSLRFAGGDGHEYVFRSLDKDAARGLPPELREGLVPQIAQDQVATFHPAAPLVVARLLDATGIRHAHPRLVMMPDDPALGEFRAEFRNTLGTLEERAGESFDEGADSAGATKAAGSARLFELLREQPGTVVDTRGYLAARLFDLVVGDRDRHRDQWRWAAFDGPSGTRWEPVPRDRDMAFVREDGLVIAITRRSYPQLVTFGDRYPAMFGLTWNGREIDRRLLVWLDRAVWDSTARALQAQLTDSVIDDAIAAMPPELAAHDADRLRRALRRRRDALPGAARRFYDLLAGEVDLRGTDSADVVEVTRLDGGAVEVALTSPAADGTRGTTLRRRFTRGETRDVRLFLFDGDDRVVVRGEGGGGVTVRVVGGKGDDVLVDSTRRGARAIRFYDASGGGRATGTHRIHVDRPAYTPPPTLRAQDPPRDWGSESKPAPWISYAPDVGLFLGAGQTRIGYGFRSDPYRSRLTAQAGWAFGARRPRAQLTGVLRREGSADYGVLEARASGIEVVRFHGFGNDTPLDHPSPFYRVFQTQYLLEPAYVRAVSRGMTASLGAVAQLTTSDERAGTLLGVTRPYGSGRFGEAGARAGLALDRRDRPVAATRGTYADAGGTIFPALWDVQSTFGEAHGNVAAYIPVPVRRDDAPTLALRAGGRRVWGRFPFHESAFVGGGSTLRGYAEQRFAGRGALYGNAELRVHLGHFVLLVPNEFGAFGLADAGRVYVPGEQSRSWHPAFGGGVWVAPVRPSHTISLAVARGDERTGIYLRSGFLF